MNKSISIGFLSRILAIGSNIIIMPIILNIMQPKQFSLWMLFVSFYSCIVILDFGFSATASRYYSYITSGASKFTLIKSHIHEKLISNCTSKINKNQAYSLYSNINKINNSIFSFITALAIIFFTIIYFIYSILLKNELSNNDSLSWFLFSISIIILIYSLKYNGFLHGTGNVSCIYLSNIISNLSFLILAVVLLYSNLSLLGLCIARLFSSIVYFLLMFFFNKKKFPMVPIKIEKDKALNYIILKSSMKLGFGSLGNFLANRTTIFILTALFPLYQISSDTLVINICITILSISLIVNNNFLPKISQLRIESNNKKLAEAIKENYYKSIFIYLFLFFIFFISAPFLLELINSKTKLPNNATIILLGLIFLFELVQSISTSMLATNNKLSFPKYQIIFGCIFIGASFIIGSLFINNISTLSILLLQLFSQLIFNNWYWAIQVFKEINEMKTV